MRRSEPKKYPTSRGAFTGALGVGEEPAIAVAVTVDDGLATAVEVTVCGIATVAAGVSVGVVGFEPGVGVSVVVSIRFSLNVGVIGFEPGVGELQALSRPRMSNPIPANKPRLCRPKGMSRPFIVI